MGMLSLTFTSTFRHSVSASVLSVTSPGQEMRNSCTAMATSILQVWHYNINPDKAKLKNTCVEGNPTLPKFTGET